jgi:hypothetical protein
MEINGGLDRRVATLSAFELCFPGEFRECMRIAAGTPDGETVLYEFLEGLLINSQYARESPLLNEYSPGRENRQSPKDLPIAQEARLTRQGLAALEYMTSQGIPLIGVYENGATIAKGEAWAAAFTVDMDIIKALIIGQDSRIKRPIHRFYFIPPGRRASLHGH